MKKWIALLLCLMMLLALTACTGNDDPTKGQKNDKSFADVQKELRNITDSDDKSDIEKNIKKVFGISISLPSGSEYDAEVMELSELSSVYAVIIEGADVSAEEYYSSIKQSFSGWNANDAEYSFAYETEAVIYGAVIDDTDGVLTVAFSVTDPSFVDAFTSDLDTFYATVKKWAGTTVTLPEFISSLGLGGGSNEGALAEYGGMLLSQGGNITKAQFDQVVASLSSQLKGYTKSEEGDDTDLTVTWTKDTDPTIWLEAAYYEFDGTPMSSISFHYTDTSLLTAWPAGQIDKMMGTATNIPAYSGAYSDLEVQEESYDDEHYLEITVKDANEEEFDAWLENLTAAGFQRIGGNSEYSEVYWSKAVTDTLFVEISGYYDDWDGDGTIYIYRTVLDNVNWPEAGIRNQLGDKVADLIPAMESATYRTFEVYDNDYRTINVMNIVDQELFDSYCRKLADKGFFIDGYDNTTYKNYAYEWDNYDRLELTVGYEESDDAGYKYIWLSIEFVPYEPVVNLPQNVKIQYRAKSAYSDNVDEYTVVKIGENWFVRTSYQLRYYKYDSTTRTWESWYAYTAFDGTVSWKKNDKVLDRYEMDEQIESFLSNIREEDILEDPESYTAGNTKTIAGQTCRQYTYSYSDKVYYYHEATGLIFSMVSTHSYGNDVYTATTEITEYDTSVTSFADADVTLPETTD